MSMIYFTILENIVLLQSTSYPVFKKSRLYNSEVHSIFLDYCEPKNKMVWNHCHPVLACLTSSNAEGYPPVALVIGLFP
jgi:hypothetical protein